MVRNYKSAPLDKSTAIITILSVVGLLLVIFASLGNYKIKGTIFYLMIAVASILLLLFSFFLFPKIKIVDNTLRVRNPLFGFTLPLQHISSVEEIRGATFSIRKFGIGGLNGFYGYYSGSEFWMVTSKKRRVKITLKNGKNYLLSPEDPQKFIEELNKERENVKKEII